MFSKIKKVLFSLALASSLALAPMNVSATNPQLTEQDQSGSTQVFYKKAEPQFTYKVEVPDKIEFTSENDTQDVTISLVETSDSNKNINVTPAFEASDSYSNVTISFTDASVTVAKVGDSKKTVATLSDGSNELGEIVDSTEIGTIAYAINTGE